MVKTNKDFLFLLILVGWIIIDTLSLAKFGSDITICITNPIVILIIAIIVIFKINSNRFNRWLNKDF